MNKWHYIAISIVCLVLSVAIARSDSKKIQLEHYSFHIPAEFLLESSVPNWLRWLPGVDKEDKGLLFRLSAELLSKNVTGYKEADGRYREDIRGYLVVLTKLEQERYSDSSQYRDIIFGIGSYTDRVVQQDGYLYKVFRKIEYPYSFALVTKNPNEISIASRDFWVAHCLKRKNSVTNSQEHVNCSSYVVKDDLLVEFNISKQNIQHIEMVKQYLLTKVMEWQVN